LIEQDSSPSDVQAKLPKCDNIICLITLSVVTISWTHLKASSVQNIGVANTGMKPYSFYALPFILINTFIGIRHAIAI
jgi:hypothetical protein